MWVNETHDRKYNVTAIVNWWIPFSRASIWAAVKDVRLRWSFRFSRSLSCSSVSLFCPSLWLLSEPEPSLSATTQKMVSFISHLGQKYVDCQSNTSNTQRWFLIWPRILDNHKQPLKNWILVCFLIWFCSYSIMFSTWIYRAFTCYINKQIYHATIGEHTWACTYVRAFAKIKFFTSAAN